MPISALPIFDKKSREAFTLVELLVVVALIALITLVALPQISNFFKVSLNSVTLNLATTIHEAYNGAAITGRVVRLVYDLEKQQFWVESGPSDALLDTEESKKIEENRKKYTKEEPTKKPGFDLEASITPKKIDLPRGIKFFDVYTSQSELPLTEGKAYTHFFPNGVTEQTVVRLMDSQEHKISLVVNSLVGKTKVYNEHVDPKKILEN